MLRATTRFHANEARCSVGNVLQESLTLDLYPHDLAGLSINPVQLKDPLGNVNAHHRFATIVIPNNFHNI